MVTRPWLVRHAQYRQSWPGILNRVFSLSLLATPGSHTLPQSQ